MDNPRHIDESRVQRIEHKIDKLTEAVAGLVRFDEKISALVHRTEALEGFMARCYMAQNEAIKSELLQEAKITALEHEVLTLQNSPTKRAMWFVGQLVVTVVITVVVTNIVNRYMG